ncbi:hypothetical protein, partial [Streptomyces sp. NPDC019937]|uniref:hypothetical protein n=1 Tax=Streptomyces sp. NPDC019937 TaxID=3154787 RepID=UPI0033C09242
DERGAARCRPPRQRLMSQRRREPGMIGKTPPGHAAAPNDAEPPAGPAAGTGYYTRVRSVILYEEQLVLEAVFTTLLILVIVASLGFVGLTWKKLYQGQR